MTLPLFANIAGSGLKQSGIAGNPKGAAGQNAAGQSAAGQVPHDAAGLALEFLLVFGQSLADLQNFNQPPADAQTATPVKPQPIQPELAKPEAKRKISADVQAVPLSVINLGTTAKYAPVVGGEVNAAPTDSKSSNKSRRVAIEAIPVLPEIVSAGDAKEAKAPVAPPVQVSPSAIPAAPIRAKVQIHVAPSAVSNESGETVIQFATTVAVQPLQSAENLAAVTAALQSALESAPQLPLETNPQAKSEANAPSAIPPSEKPIVEFSNNVSKPSSESAPSSASIPSILQIVIDTVSKPVAEAGPAPVIPSSAPIAQTAKAEIAASSERAAASSSPAAPPAQTAPPEIHRDAPVDVLSANPTPKAEPTVNEPRLDPAPVAEAKPQPQVAAPPHTVSTSKPAVNIAPTIKAEAQAQPQPKAVASTASPRTPDLTPPAKLEPAAKPVASAAPVLPQTAPTEPTPAPSTAAAPIAPALPQIISTEPKVVSTKPAVVLAPVVSIAPPVAIVPATASTPTIAPAAAPAAIPNAQPRPQALVQSPAPVSLAPAAPSAPAAPATRTAPHVQVQSPAQPSIQSSVQPSAQSPLQPPTQSSAQALTQPTPQTQPKVAEADVKPAAAPLPELPTNSQVAVPVVSTVHAAPLARPEAPAPVVVSAEIASTPAPVPAKAASTVSVAIDIKPSESKIDDSTKPRIRSSGDPAATSSHPEIAEAPLNFNVQDLVAQLRAIAGRPAAAPDASARSTSTITFSSDNQSAKEAVSAAPASATSRPSATDQALPIWTSNLLTQNTIEAKPASTASFAHQLRDAADFLAARVDGTVRVGSREIQAELKLYPPDLGRVRVEMTLTSDKTVQAHFIAERSDTGQLLNQNMRQFTEALNQQGLSVERIQVSLEPKAVREQGSQDRMNQDQRNQGDRSQRDLSDGAGNPRRRDEEAKNRFRAWENYLN